MKQSIVVSLTTILLLSQLTACAVPSRHFWEIPDQQLPYIAMIRVDPSFGTAVIYNPDTCEQIGAACGFFRAHANAHSSLSHQILANPGSYPNSLEVEADCWAARNAASEEVHAAVELMLDENRDPDIRITGDPAERAEIIRECALASGNWI